MPKRKNKEQWIKQATEIHNSKYDYSLWSDNISLSSNEQIYCPIHGIFEQNLKSHIINKSGCPKCGYETKRKQTCLDKYGVENPIQLKEIQLKKKQTCLDRYGVENSMHFEKFKVKQNQTRIERHGKEYRFHNSQSRKNAKQTMLDRYGVEHASHSLIIREKIKQTMLDRYGVDNPAKSPDFSKKKKQSCLNRFNVENNVYLHVSQQTLDKLNNKNWLIEQHHNQRKSLKQISNEIGDISLSTLSRWFKTHNIEVKYFYQSIGEIQINNVITSLGFKTIIKSRLVISPYELDIFIPECNIAIEYNGEYWHGDSFPQTQERDKIKHQMCKDKGILLIVVWDTDWKNNRNQVKQSIINVVSEKMIL